MNHNETEILLAELGIVIWDRRGDEFIALCPGHFDRTGKVDSNPSWSFNSETGLHNCFSCGFKGGLLYLIAFQKDLFDDLGRPDWSEAKAWLSVSHEVDLTELMRKLDAASKHAEPFKPVVMSEARLAMFDVPPMRALKARRLTATSCAALGVLWDDKNECWITPIREPYTHDLMGWQEKGQGNRHFRNRPAGVRKALTLFGIDVWPGGDMVVVESPLDVVRLKAVGVNGVSTFGASVSKEQVQLMLASDRLILAFDNDAAGKKASQFMLEQSRSLGFECSFFDYSHTTAKDVGDMEEVEILRGLLGARHCVMGKAAIA